MFLNILIFFSWKWLLVESNVCVLHHLPLTRALLYIIFGRVICLVHVSDRTLINFCESQAGTYIKEFVHGDLGRTHPRYEKSFDHFELMILLRYSYDERISTTVRPTKWSMSLLTMFLSFFAALVQFLIVEQRYCNLMSQM